MAIPGRVDIKINQLEVDRLLKGQTAGNKLPDVLKKSGQAIVDRAQRNTQTAPNHIRGKRRSQPAGKPGRVDTGALQNSYQVEYKQDGYKGQPEVRVGSTLPYAAYQEFGTDKILPGNMLKNAAEEVTGQSTPQRYGKF